MVKSLRKSCAVSKKVVFLQPIKLKREYKFIQIIPFLRKGFFSVTDLKEIIRQPSGCFFCFVLFAPCTNNPKHKGATLMPRPLSAFSSFRIANADI